VRNCSALISQSERVVTMSQYEFRQICDTKLESLQRRITNYQQVGRPPPHGGGSSR
jgi:phosphatidylinositol-3,4,5-trisphosphate-dependent Rac exchanger protein 1